MNFNPLLLIDGYKLDHRRQYPEDVTKVYSNFTPRGSRIDGQTSVVFLGLQYFLERYLNEMMHMGFFARDIDSVCREYENFVNSYLGPNSIGTDHIAQLHQLGYMPLEFRALPEGTDVPLRIPMLTIENTHPDFAWLVNYIETLLSNVLWMPCTSATTALRYRRILEQAAIDTGSPVEFVDWQGHDFSFRGMTSPEAAALSGLGHLAFFTGTDTIPAIQLADRYYHVKDANYLYGGSVAATEHSVMCAGGQMTEIETFDRLLNLYPEGIVSVVSDTWDLWNVCVNILPKLSDKIMGREGKLVIRPDSGDPVAIICGDPSAPIDHPAHKGVVELLWDVFGGTVTETGHKMLDPHVGVIYGDSITESRARAIVDNLETKGFASANMVFGIGSYTYQYVTRDTYGFAMKATWVERGGEGVDIFKDPITDSGLKKSAVGRLAVLLDDKGDLSLVDRASAADEEDSLLRPVWRDGRFIVRQTLEDVRKTAANAVILR